MYNNSYLLQTFGKVPGTLASSCPDQIVTPADGEEHIFFRYYVIFLFPIITELQAHALPFAPEPVPLRRCGRRFVEV